MDGKNVEMSGREEERVKAESWRLKRPAWSHLQGGIELGVIEMRETLPIGGVAEVRSRKHS
jgi:hypothetical protein